MGSISGLATGNDWNSTIDQLMAVERKPITAWVNRQNQYTRDKDAWKDINSRLLSLKTKSEALTESSLWQGRTATSSDTSVFTATADNTATAGTYDLKVKQLALAQQVRSAQQADAWTVGADSSFTLNGKLISVTAGQTLAQVASAINSADYADGDEVSATVVDNHLILKAAEPGSANTLTLSDTSGTLMTDLNVISAPDTFVTELQGAQDAIFSVDGIEVTRSANTGIDDVITGVTISLQDVTGIDGIDAWPADYSAATLTVATDTGSIFNAVKAWVDQYNSSTDFIRRQTQITLGSDGAVSGTGELAGNIFATQIENRLYNVAMGRYSSAGEYTSLSAIGVELGTYGTSDANKLIIDETALRAAITANPDAVRSLFAKDTDGSAGYDEGIAVGMDEYLTPLTQYGGLLADQQDAMQSSIDMLQDRIDAFDLILERREAGYRTTFTNLEMALAKFQNTASWLTGQLSQLGN